MTSHQDVAGLLLRLRDRVHDAPMDHEHMMDDAIEALEAQAKALSEWKQAASVEAGLRREFYDRAKISTNPDAGAS